MEEYDGAKCRAEWPVGGGSNNARRCGDEVHNFTKIRGRVYGFCQPPANSKEIALRRIQPGWHESALSDVLVVFVAVDPQRGKQRVVGWYRDATLYRTRQKCNSRKRRGKKYYYATAKVRDGILLRVEPYERNWCVPAGRGAIGQANVRYLYTDDETREKLGWANRILKKINNWQRQA